MHKPPCESSAALLDSGIIMRAIFSLVWHQAWRVFAYHSGVHSCSPHIACVPGVRDVVQPRVCSRPCRACCLLSLPFKLQHVMTDLARLGMQTTRWPSRTCFCRSLPSAALSRESLLRSAFYFVLLPALCCSLPRVPPCYLPWTSPRHARVPPPLPFASQVRAPDGSIIFHQEGPDVSFDQGVSLKGSDEVVVAFSSL